MHILAWNAFWAVTGNPDMTYENDLKAVNLPSLVYCRYSGDMIEVHKYLHVLYFLPETVC